MLNNTCPRVIILAAGQGTRLSAIYDGLPKCLFPFGNEMLLQRTLRQFEESGFQDITVVTGYRAEEVANAAKSILPNVSIALNREYKTDRNILSVLLGIGDSAEPFLLVEGDVAFSDDAVLVLRDALTSSRSVLFANGGFNQHQHGGILSADRQGNITDIRYEHYSSELACYFKNLGVAYVGRNEVACFTQLLKTHAETGASEHYFFLWAANRDRLPAVLCNLTEDGGASFNTPEEYQHALAIIMEPQNQSEPPPVELADVANLRHVEDYDRDRAAWLAEKIRSEGIWTVPVCVSRELDIVMDGQHRLEAALLLGIRKIPVVKYSYKDVMIWSLRPEIPITHTSLLDKIRGGGLFPYKTVKHKFPSSAPKCRYDIEDLFQ